MPRISSIDFMRGIVMIIMALDHVRDLIHVDAITQSPTNLQTTSPVLFFTRWVTYLCAPVFVFLAGTSVFISLRNSPDLEKTKASLLTRGLYLLLLEFTVVNFLVFFDFGFHTLLFEVIGTIGFGFIVLSLSLRLSDKSIGLMGVIILFSHNLLAFIPSSQDSLAKTVLSPFFNPSVFPLSADRVLVVAYPPVPWLGIMLVGFAAGKLFESTVAIRSRLFLQTGFGALLLFIVLRLINVYGDPAPWTVQTDPVYTFLSFLNVTKYPPSLIFSLMTLGVMFIILALSQQAKGKLADIVAVYGRVPLFYFLLHFLVIHCTMIVILLVQGFEWKQLDFASGSFGRPKGIESGVSLGVVYFIWIAVVLILYKPCLWFGKYKLQNRQAWLKYI
ncbi:MAG: hypothetical protein C0490_08920 [Marivirga sp.]|nr:hypothetical protein [Marivirga sp.]